MGFLPAFQSLPESVQRVLKVAVRDLEPTKIILFGSRARGDHRENSDYDIGFEGLNKLNRWKQFLVDAHEEPWSLQSMDLVLIDELDERFRNHICAEGRILYVR